MRSILEGFYVEDGLQGQGLYTYEDGAVLYGTYLDGELNGPAQECDAEGRLVFKGQYKDNDRCGECWIYYPVSQRCAHWNTVPVWRIHSHMTSSPSEDEYLIYMAMNVLKSLVRQEYGRNMIYFI